MGFRVRSHHWAYCVWLPWNPKTLLAEWPARDASPKLAELYDHSADSGQDFNAMDLVNLAYDPAHAAAALQMYGHAFDFFNVAAPSPSPPSGECAAAGGIQGSDGVACCASICGKCGGRGCAKLPGGKDKCCKGEVESNGRDCKTARAPCSVHT